MLGEYDFHVLQIQHIKAAMDELPTFRPLYMTPLQMQTEYNNGVTVRTNYQSKTKILDLRRGEYHEKTEAAHQAAISVYSVMKQRYGNDPGSLEAITKLPTQDKTPEDTRVRGELTTSLWAELPNDPYAVPPGPMVAWPGMDRAAFDAIFATMDTEQKAFVVAFQVHEKAQGDLHAKEAHLADLAKKVLAEGRAQFLVGKPEREVIDAIPIEPSTQPPNQAVISVATSPAGGEAHLEFDAPHATSFDVLHKGPDAIEFTLVADDILEKVYNATGLAAGNHQFKVIGQNSRGNGPESAVSSLTLVPPPPPPPGP